MYATLWMSFIRIVVSGIITYIPMYYLVLLYKPHYMDLFAQRSISLTVVILSGVALDLIAKTVFFFMGNATVRNAISKKNKRTKGRMLNLLKHYDFLGSKDTLKDMEEMKAERYFALSMNVVEENTANALVRLQVTADFFRTIFVAFLVALIISVYMLAIGSSNLRIMLMILMMLLSVAAYIASVRNYKKIFELAWDSIYIRHADKSYIIGLS